MGSLAQGAALGAVFQLLLSLFVNAARKVFRFSSDLNRLESTLSSIKLVIDRNAVNSSNIYETEGLREGEDLIQKCSDLKCWNVFRKLYYSHKLANLEASLMSFFQRYVAALHFGESKRISTVVSNLEEKMNEMAILLKRSNEIGKATPNRFAQSFPLEREMVVENGSRHS